MIKEIVVSVIIDSKFRDEFKNASGNGSSVVCISLPVL